MAVQGHVVAEQQLPLPSDWLQWDEDAMEEAPSPSTSPLQYTKEQRQGQETVVITGANDLCIEVITFCQEKPVSRTSMFVLESSRRSVFGCQVQLFCIGFLVMLGVQAKGMMECCRSTLQQAPWTDGRWAATACLRRASPPASSERRWTTIWVAAGRQPSLPGTALTQQHTCVDMREGRASSQQIWLAGK